MAIANESKGPYRVNNSSLEQKIEQPNLAYERLVELFKRDGEKALEQLPSSKDFNFWLRIFDKLEEQGYKGYKAFRGVAFNRESPKNWLRRLVDKNYGLEFIFFMEGGNNFLISYFSIHCQSKALGYRFCEGGQFLLGNDFKPEDGSKFDDKLLESAVGKVFLGGPLPPRNQWPDVHRIAHGIEAYLCALGKDIKQID